MVVLKRSSVAVIDSKELFDVRRIEIETTPT